MKHALLVFALIILGYAGYVLAGKAERRIFTKQLIHHSFRLGGLLAVAATMVWAALHLSSTPIF